MIQRFATVDSWQCNTTLCQTALFCICCVFLHCRFLHCAPLYSSALYCAPLRSILEWNSATDLRVKRLSESGGQTKLYFAFPPNSALLHFTFKEVSWAGSGTASSHSAPGFEEGTRKGTADLRLKRFSAFSSKIVTRRLDVGQTVLFLLLWSRLDEMGGATKTR